MKPNVTTSKLNIVDLDDDEDVMASIGQVVESELKKVNISDGEISKISNSIKLMVHQEFGGRTIYFKKNIKINVTQAKEKELKEIYDLFMDGYSVHKLAKMFNTTLQTIYKKIRLYKKWSKNNVN